MKRTARALWTSATLAAACATAPAGSVTGTKQSTRLYTEPDPAATGGIAFSLPATCEPLEAAIAVPVMSRDLAYNGQVAADGRSVRFAGLPVNRYDLVLVFDGRIVEGVLLNRDASTLTDADRGRIKSTVDRSIAFFDTKAIHRCEGVAGAEGRAAAVLQEVRTRPITLQDASVRTDIQVRSLKLAFFEDVGPGWHMVRSREIIRQEVGPGDAKGLLAHQHEPQLQGIRVMDDVRDLGTIAIKAK